MTYRHRLTDAELDAAIERARNAAHGAPKSLPGSESIAWAQRSREYFALLDERDRNSLGEGLSGTQEGK